jgi:trans-aconitate 2-methyltransferase
MSTLFEFDGNKYRKASVHQKEWGNKIIAELVLNGSERILDLGCGDGTLTRLLAERVPDGFVMGIDSSKGMIEIAKGLESKNTSFQLLRINEMDFANEFDVIFSNATLHWIIDHKNLLKRSYKALKKHGYIRFNFAGDGNCSTFNNVIKQVMEYEAYREFFKSFQWPWYMPSLDDYKRLVDSSNFTETKVWEENADRYFPTKNEMIAWIDQPSLVPFIRLVNDSKKQQFRDEVVRQILKIALQSDGHCFETFRRINVYAKKK